MDAKPDFVAQAAAVAVAVNAQQQQEEVQADLNRVQRGVRRQVEAPDLPLQRQVQAHQAHAHAQLNAQAQQLQQRVQGVHRRQDPNAYRSTAEAIDSILTATTGAPRGHVPDAEVLVQPEDTEVQGQDEDLMTVVQEFRKKKTGYQEETDRAIFSLFLGPQALLVATDEPEMINKKVVIRVATDRLKGQGIDEVQDSGISKAINHRFAYVLSRKYQNHQELKTTYLSQLHNDKLQQVEARKNQAPHLGGPPAHDLGTVAKKMSVKDWENPPQGSRSRRCLELLKKGKANRYAYLYDMKASSRACRQWLCHLKFRDEQSDQEYHNSVEEFLKQEKEQRNHIKEQKEKQAKLINHTPSTYLCRQEFEEGVRFYMGHPNFDATIHKPSDLVYERVGREMRVGLPIVKHHVPQVLPGFMPLATRNPLRRTSASLGPEMIYSSFFIPTDCSLESVVVTATTRGITISCKRVDPLSKKGSVSPPPKKPKRLRDMGPGAKLPANPVTVHRGGAPHENVQDIVAIARAQAMNRTPAILPGNLNPAMTRQNLAPAALTPANLNPNGKWPNHIFDRAVLGAASLSLAPAGAAQHPGAAHVGPHVPPSAALSAAQLAATHPHAHHAHHPSLARAGQPMPKKRKLDHGVPPQVLPQQPGPE